MIWNQEDETLATASSSRDSAVLTPVGRSAEATGESPTFTPVAEPPRPRSADVPANSLEPVTSSGWVNKLKESKDSGDLKAKEATNVAQLQSLATPLKKCNLHAIRFQHACT